jgi:CheY-like chemotaxis protein
MAIKKHPVFTRDGRTGEMTEYTPDEPEAAADASQQGITPQARVLVVDDSEPDRLLTIFHLGQAWPFERHLMAECAADGAEALEKIRGRPFELVVLDWNMPRVDGDEVLRTMRHSGVRIPVVVLSGQRRDDIATDLEAMTAVYVNKNELDVASFRGAITASIQLQENRGGACH